jgi:hypothetical protein
MNHVEAGTGTLIHPSARPCIITSHRKATYGGYSTRATQFCAETWRSMAFGVCEACITYVSFVILTR